MKASVQSLVETTLPTEKGWLSVFSELFKARLTLLVLLTTLMGFYLGFKGPVDYWLMLNTVLATALVAGAASALNQLWEQDYDKKMTRTRERPLPSGRLQPQTVLFLGLGMALVGLAYLCIAVNLLTALLGAVSLLSYLFV